MKRRDTFKLALATIVASLAPSFGVRASTQEPVMDPGFEFHRVFEARDDKGHVTGYAIENIEVSASELAPGDLYAYRLRKSVRINPNDERFRQHAGGIIWRVPKSVPGSKHFAPTDSEGVILCVFLQPFTPTAGPYGFDPKGFVVQTHTPPTCSKPSAL